MRNIRSTLFILLQLICASALAQSGVDWPSRPIVIVTPYTPGASDISVRAYTSIITEATRWNFVLGYKPGASG